MTGPGTGSERPVAVIGITGGIATGKTAAALFLCERLAAFSISADTVCRELLRPGKRGWCVLKELLGEPFFVEDGTVNRPLLRERLFGDRELRARLNASLHPLVREEIAARLRFHRDDRSGDPGSAAPSGACGPLPARMVIVEVPLLYEAGWQGDFARTVLIYADCSQSVRRLMSRDGVSLAHAEESLRAQMPIREKVMLADHVVDNGGAWAATCLELMRLAELLAGKRSAAPWPAG